MAHHLEECANNGICNALSLANIEIDDEDDGVDNLGTSKHPKPASPKKPYAHNGGTGQMANRPLCIDMYLSTTLGILYFTNSAISSVTFVGFLHC